MTKTSVKPSDTGPLFARSPLEDGTSEPLSIRKRSVLHMVKGLQRWKAAKEERREFWKALKTTKEKLLELSGITLEEDDEEDEASNVRFHSSDFWKNVCEALKSFSDYEMILFRGFHSIKPTLPKIKCNPKLASDLPYCRVNSLRRLKDEEEAIWLLNSHTVAQSTSTAYPIGIQPSSGGGGQLHNPQANRNKEHVILIPSGGGQLHNPQANRNKEHVILIPSGLADTHPETGVASTMVDNSSSSGANPDDNRSPSEANPDDNRS